MTCSPYFESFVSTVLCDLKLDAHVIQVNIYDQPLMGNSSVANMISKKKKRKARRKRKYTHFYCNKKDWFPHLSIFGIHM